MTKKVLFEVRERSADPAFQVIEDDNGQIQTHYGATYNSEADVMVGVKVTSTGALMGPGGVIPFSGTKTVGGGAIFIGTSVTNQGFTNGGRDASGWQVPMSIALGWPFDPMIDAATSGQSTSYHLANWDTLVSPFYDQFQTAFIEIGPNDANNLTVPAATTIANVLEMSTRLLALGKLVVILTPTWAETHDTQAELEHTSRVNQWVQDYASTTDNVLYAEAGRVLSSPADGKNYAPMVEGSSDRTHPRYAGSAVIGKEVARRMPLIRKVSRGSQTRRDHKEYCNNPFLSGAVATGVRGYQAGTGVTGSGPESCSVGITGGTFSSVTVSKGSSLDDNSSPIIVTAAGASADWAGLIIRVGSEDTTVTGSVQRGRHDFNWATGTTYTIGDHARHSTLTDGILNCVGLVSGNTGVSGGTQPAPTAGAYGEIITDGGVIWMWQKLPAVGDVMFAESDYSITNLTGGIAPKFGFRVVRAGAELFAETSAPFFDISGSSGAPPSTWPLSGRVRTAEQTLINPGDGINVRHIYAEWRIYFTAGGGGTITIPRVSIRRV